MAELSDVAGAFVEMAHRIVWCTVATVDRTGSPRTRVLHPIWEWDGEALTGWVATSPLSPKAAHLASTPRVSLTYWDPSQDTCTADCAAAWVPDGEKAQLWDRFADGPAPVGYDPRLIPAWTAPDVPAFGGLVLHPTRLRVQPASMMTTGRGELLTWEA